MLMTMSMMIHFCGAFLYNLYRLIYRNELCPDDFYDYSQLMMMMLHVDNVVDDIVVMQVV